MKKTYSLLLEGESISETYYIEISEISNRVINVIEKQGKEYINEYMEFIEGNEIEKLRSFNEYGIELLLIGVLFTEYIDNARAFKYIIKTPFTILNRLRINKIKNKKSYERLDKIRGVLVNRYLRRKIDGRGYLTIKDLILLSKWLEATNDYNEELIRIKGWIKFLKEQGSGYSQNLISEAIEMAKQLYNIGEKYLSKYTKHVYTFNEQQKKIKSNREDIIFRTRTEIQYYFNMVCAEIMNMEYRDEYIKSNEKLIFLPSCLRQANYQCKSEVTSRGKKCKSCIEECNVNKITTKAKEHSIVTYIIPHESDIDRYINRGTKKGLIGVACVLNLMSGGWKALRIGYIPQCILIDAPGCSAHWQDKDIMTSINIDRIIIQ